VLGVDPYSVVAAFGGVVVVADLIPLKEGAGVVFAARGDFIVTDHVVDAVFGAEAAHQVLKRLVLGGRVGILGGFYGGVVGGVAGEEFNADAEFIDSGAGIGGGHFALTGVVGFLGVGDEPDDDSIAGDGVVAGDAIDFEDGFDELPIVLVVGEVFRVEADFGGVFTAFFAEFGVFREEILEAGVEPVDGAGEVDDDGIDFDGGCGALAVGFGGDGAFNEEHFGFEGDVPEHGFGLRQNGGGGFHGGLLGGIRFGLEFFGFSGGAGDQDEARHNGQEGRVCFFVCALLIHRCAAPAGKIGIHGCFPNKRDSPPSASTLQRRVACTNHNSLLLSKSFSRRQHES
jgi:hypothetical protein